MKEQVTIKDKIQILIKISKVKDSRPKTIEWLLKKLKMHRHTFAARDDWYLSEIATIAQYFWVDYMLVLWDYKEWDTLMRFLK